jgi:hypothetical protein
MRGRITPAKRAPPPAGAAPRGGPADAWAAAERASPTKGAARPRSRSFRLARLAAAAAARVAVAALTAAAGSRRAAADAAAAAAAAADAAPPPPPRRACRAPTPADAAPRLARLALWPPAGGAPPPPGAIALLTHLTPDRLAALENQCVSWPDPLVAVVALPVAATADAARHPSGLAPLLPRSREAANTTLGDVLRGMESFHAYMGATAACALTLELVAQVVEAPGLAGGEAGPGGAPLPVSQRAAPEEPPYPVNALRNRALALAPTALVLPLDVDFVPAPGLGLPGGAGGHRTPGAAAALAAAAAAPAALVLPALDVANRWQDLATARNVARGVAVGGKAAAAAALAARRLAPYRAPAGPAAHRATGVERWARLPPGAPPTEVRGVAGFGGLGLRLGLGGALGDAPATRGRERCNSIPARPLSPLSEPHSNSHLALKTRPPPAILPAGQARARLRAPGHPRRRFRALVGRALRRLRRRRRRARGAPRAAQVALPRAADRVCGPRPARAHRGRDALPRRPARRVGAPPIGRALSSGRGGD